MADHHSRDPRSPDLAHVLQRDAGQANDSVAEAVIAAFCCCVDRAAERAVLRDLLRGADGRATGHVFRGAERLVLGAMVAAAWLEHREGGDVAEATRTREGARVLEALELAGDLPRAL